MWGIYIEDRKPRVFYMYICGFITSSFFIAHANCQDKTVGSANDTSTESCFNTITFEGASTIFGEQNRKLTVTNSSDVTVQKITNPAGWFGKGFSAELEVKSAQNVTITEIAHQNYTGGSWLHVKADNKLTANNVYFTQDGIDGSQGHIELQAKEVNITNLTGRKQQHIVVKGNNGGDGKADKIVVENMGFAEDICITDSCGGTITLEGKSVVIKTMASGNNNETGIRAGNFVTVKGDNFYGGQIHAFALPTAGSNSTLDLSGVTGTTFIDDFLIRTGTLKANNFHINKFSVSKGNSHSVVDTNIGKSFINYLSMEIGTSNTADGADIRFTGGGEILNFNFIDARPTSFVRMGDITNVNVEQMNIKEGEVNVKNGIFNTIVSTKGQTIITNGASKLTANALNVNELLHIKDGSKHSGVMHIELSGNEEVNQDFSKYLNVGIDSDALKKMSKSEIEKLINDSNGNANGAQESDYKNASGTYVTTSDGKHYLILPDIMTHDNITNSSVQATNGGNLLIEQTTLTKGALNNYGTILLDSGFVSGNTPALTLKGNLNNYDTIDIGANGKIDITGDFNNKGRLIFRIQSNPNDINNTEVKNGVLNITGKTTFDISPGSSGAFQADIADPLTLSYLGGNTTKTYEMVKVGNGGSISYTYTNGDYTTTFSKENGQTNIKTEALNGTSCNNTDCQTNTNGQTQQETEFTTNNQKNPWDMEKAESDSSGNVIENGVGQNDNHGNLIQKPSQSDKKPNCKENGYCGFGDNANASEADRGYDYAQEKMKNSFALTYKGGSIDGKYINVEKIVTDTSIGFKVNRVNAGDFMEGGAAETPLCTQESSAFDCALYMEAGGNNSWIHAIQKESVNSYEILKQLFYDEKSALVFLVNLDQTLAASRNLDYFLEVGRTLDTALQHVANLENKASTLHTLNLAMESARINRLTKLASMHGGANEWLAMQNYQKNLELALKEAEKLRFASSDSDSVNEVWFDTLADLIMRFNKREEYPNHVWVNMLGNLNFSNTGTAQLYGFNAGYDYFVEGLQTAFGAYGGYGYGTFNGSNNGFTSNNSNNIFAGIYTRTFIENHEIDATLNTTYGFVHERQNSRINNFELLNLFKDDYNYMLANVDLNATYGYAFLFKKGYVVKPFVGLSYYVLGSSSFQRDTPTNSPFAMNTTDNTRQTLALNIGVDSRKYFANQSYVFLVAQLKQDAIILQNNVDKKGYVSTDISNGTSQFNMSYKAQDYRSYVFLTGGGEYSFGRWYLNGSISAQTSVFDKNFGLGFNVGGRVVF